MTLLGRTEQGAKKKEDVKKEESERGDNRL